jgi:uncharacterized protein YaaQ
MKLMICIVNRKYSSRMMQDLGQHGYRITKLASTGGFLKEGNDTLLIGAANEDIVKLKERMKQSVKELEEAKGWKGNTNRFTCFILKGQSELPLFKQ